MNFENAREAWRVVAEAMTFLENEGELLINTLEIRGVERDARYNGKNHEWEVIHHNGQEDGN